MSVLTDNNPRAEEIQPSHGENESDELHLLARSVDGDPNLYGVSGRREATPQELVLLHV